MLTSKEGPERITGLSSQTQAPTTSELEYDITDLEPQIAFPCRVDNVKPVSEFEGTKIDQVFIGTCTNGRLEDLETAAKIIKGHKVAVRTLVIPASREILLRGNPKGHNRDPGRSRSDDWSAGMRTVPWGSHGRSR